HISVEAINPKGDLSVHIKLIVMALIWGGGFVAGKVIAPQAGAFTITFLRFLIASVVLTIILFRTEKLTSVPISIVGFALAGGFLGVGCYNFLFLNGIKWIEAGRGAVIMSIVPIAVAVLSAILFKEPLTFRKFVGILISVVGAAMVVSNGDFSIFFGNIGRGELYILGSVSCAAAFTLISKKMLDQLSPLAVIVFISSFGTVMMIIPMLIELQTRPLTGLSFAFYMNLLYLALGPSVVATVFYYHGIAKVGPSRASQYMNLMPVFAVILSFLFLGEEITSSLAVGGLMVIGGILITNKKRCPDTSVGVGS
ncbi:MAG: EamA family transporter, partial [Candidatus Omnitrophica bacterium]|nr:EamA family transporter [Candidatus Omnitrophota bacterium]